MHQSPFQRRAWAAAQRAHAAADLFDARILMRLIQAVDDDDYVVIEPLARALQAGYREAIGAIPTSRSADLDDGGDSEGGDGDGDDEPFDDASA